MAHYVIGDLHGHLNDYRRLLQNQALTDAADQWTGGTHQLWLIGDFFDRGDKGVECVELTMQLQRQARAVGGDVNAILGNHELMLLCAYKFGEQLTSSGVSAKSLWIRWGGIDAELARLKPEHIHWLERLPALQRVGDALLLHADAMFYVEHGRTVEAVNQRFFDLTQNSQPGLRQLAIGWPSTSPKKIRKEIARSAQKSCIMVPLCYWHEATDTTRRA